MVHRREAGGSVTQNDEEKKISPSNQNKNKASQQSTNNVESASEQSDVETVRKSPAKSPSQSTSTTPTGVAVKKTAARQTQQDLSPPKKCVSASPKKSLLRRQNSCSLELIDAVAAGTFTNGTTSNSSSNEFHKPLRSRLLRASRLLSTSVTEISVSSRRGKKLLGLGSASDDDSLERRQPLSKSVSAENLTQASNDLSPVERLTCSVPLDKLSVGVVKSIMSSSSARSSSSSSNTTGSLSNCDATKDTALASSVDSPANDKVGLSSHMAKLLCLYCDKKYTSQKLLVKHTNRVHAADGRRLSSRNSLSWPSILAYPGCSYCCNSGTKPITTATVADDLKSLFYHFLDVHSDKYFACKWCEIRFVNVETMDQHFTRKHSVVDSGGKVTTGKRGNRNSSSPKRIANPDLTQPLHIAVGSADRTSSPYDEETSGYSEIVYTKTRRQLKQAMQNRTLVVTRSCQNVLRNEDTILTRLGVAQNRLPRGRKGTRNRRLINMELTKPAEPVVPTVVKSRSKIGRVITSSLRDASETATATQSRSATNARAEPLSCTFDDDFYETVSVNVRKNLSCHLDGKLESGPTSPSPLSPVTTVPAIRSTVVKSPLNDDSEIHEATALATLTAFPTLLTAEQYGSDSFTEAKIKRPITKHSWKWKWDCVKKYKYVNEGGKIVKKVKQQISGLRDLSKLDMWTQLTMRTKHEITRKQNPEPSGAAEIFSIGEVTREEKRKQIAQLNTILDTRVMPQIVLEQTEQSIVKIESLETEESGAECVVAESQDTTTAEVGLIPEMLQLNRRTSSGHSDKGNLVLSGEWARPRCYICFSCGGKFDRLKKLEEHKISRHPYIMSTHYEIVGRELIEGDLYKHLYIPIKALRHHFEYKQKIREVKSENVAKCVAVVAEDESLDSVNSLTASTTSANGGNGATSLSTASSSLEDGLPVELSPANSLRHCTKCKRDCNGKLELYRHMLNCSGDYAWRIAQKRKYRYFGVKSRRHARQNFRQLQRRKAIENASTKGENGGGPTTSGSRKSKRCNPASRRSQRLDAGDADSIRRMLENLPAKRACRQIIPNITKPRARKFTKNLGINKLVNAGGKKLKAKAVTVASTTLTAITTNMRRKRIFGRQIIRRSGRMAVRCLEMNESTGKNNKTLKTQKEQYPRVAKPAAEKPLPAAEKTPEKKTPTSVKKWKKEKTDENTAEMKPQDIEIIPIDKTPKKKAIKKIQQLEKPKEPTETQPKLADDPVEDQKLIDDKPPAADNPTPETTRLAPIGKASPPPCEPLNLIVPSNPQPAILQVSPVGKRRGKKLTDCIAKLQEKLGRPFFEGNQNLDSVLSVGQEASTGAIIAATTASSSDTETVTSVSKSSAIADLNRTPKRKTVTRKIIQKPSTELSVSRPLVTQLPLKVDNTDGNMSMTSDMYDSLVDSERCDAAVIAKDISTELNDSAVSSMATDSTPEKRMDSASRKEFFSIENLAKSSVTTKEEEEPLIDLLPRTKRSNANGSPKSASSAFEEQTVGQKPLRRGRSNKSPTVPPPPPPPPHIIHYPVMEEALNLTVRKLYSPLPPIQANPSQQTQLVQLQPLALNISSRQKPSIVEPTEVKNENSKGVDDLENPSKIIDETSSVDASKKEKVKAKSKKNVNAKTRPEANATNLKEVVKTPPTSLGPSFYTIKDQLPLATATSAGDEKKAQQLVHTLPCEQTSLEEVNTELVHTLPCEQTSLEEVSAVVIMTAKKTSSKSKKTQEQAQTPPCGPPILEEEEKVNVEIAKPPKKTPNKTKKSQLEVQTPAPLWRPPVLEEEEEKVVNVQMAKPLKKTPNKSKKAQAQTPPCRPPVLEKEEKVNVEMTKTPKKAPSKSKKTLAAQTPPCGPPVIEDKSKKAQDASQTPSCGSLVLEEEENAVNVEMSKSLKKTPSKSKKTLTEVQAPPCGPPVIEDKSKKAQDVSRTPSCGSLVLEEEEKAVNVETSKSSKKTPSKSKKTLTEVQASPCGPPVIEDKSKKAQDVSRAPSCGSLVLEEEEKAVNVEMSKSSKKTPSKSKKTLAVQTPPCDPPAIEDKLKKTRDEGQTPPCGPLVLEEEEKAVNVEMTKSLKKTPSKSKKTLTEVQAPPFGPPAIEGKSMEAQNECQMPPCGPLFLEQEEKAVNIEITKPLKKTSNKSKKTPAEFQTPPCDPPLLEKEEEKANVGKTKSPKKSNKSKKTQAEGEVPPYGPPVLEDKSKKGQTEVQIPPCAPPVLKDEQLSIEITRSSKKTPIKSKKVQELVHMPPNEPTASTSEEVDTQRSKATKKPSVKSRKAAAAKTPRQLNKGHQITESESTDFVSPVEEPSPYSIVSSLSTKSESLSSIAVAPAVADKSDESVFDFVESPKETEITVNIVSPPAIADKSDESVFDFVESPKETKMTVNIVGPPTKGKKTNRKKNAATSENVEVFTSISESEQLPNLVDSKIAINETTEVILETISSDLSASNTKKEPKARATPTGRGRPKKTTTAKSKQIEQTDANWISSHEELVPIEPIVEEKSTAASSSKSIFDELRETQENIFFYRNESAASPTKKYSRKNPLVKRPILDLSFESQSKTVANTTAITLDQDSKHLTATSLPDIAGPSLFNREKSGTSDQKTADQQSKAAIATAATIAAAKRRSNRNRSCPRISANNTNISRELDEIVASFLDEERDSGAEAVNEVEAVQGPTRFDAVETLLSDEPSAASGDASETPKNTQEDDKSLPSREENEKFPGTGEKVDKHKKLCREVSVTLTKISVKDIQAQSLAKATIAENMLTNAAVPEKKTADVKFQPIAQRRSRRNSIKPESISLTEQWHDFDEEIAKTANEDGKKAADSKMVSVAKIVINTKTSRQSPRKRKIATLDTNSEDVLDGQDKLDATSKRETSTELESDRSRMQETKNTVVLEESQLTTDQKPPTDTSQPKPTTVRKRRKNELAAIVADQLLESFKEVDKSRIDELKRLENLAYEKSDDLYITGIRLTPMTKRKIVLSEHKDENTTTATTTKEKTTAKQQKRKKTQPNETKPPECSPAEKFTTSTPTDKSQTRKSHENLFCNFTDSQETPKLNVEPIAIPKFNCRSFDLSFGTFRSIATFGSVKDTATTNQSTFVPGSAETSCSIDSHANRTYDEVGGGGGGNSKSITTELSNSKSSLHKKSKKKMSRPKKEKKAENENINELRTGLESFTFGKQNLDEFSKEIFGNSSSIAVFSSPSSTKDKSILLKSSTVSGRQEAQKVRNDDDSKKPLLRPSVLASVVTQKPSRDPRLNKNSNKSGSERRRSVSPESFVKPSARSASLRTRRGSRASQQPPPLNVITSTTDVNNDEDEEEEDTCLAAIAQIVNKKIMSEDEDFNRTDEFDLISTDVVIADRTTTNRSPPMLINDQATCDVPDDDENTNTELIDMDLEDDMSVFSSFTQDVSRSRFGNRRRRRKSILLTSRRSKKQISEPADLDATFDCTICNKSFAKASALAKHQTTFTHVAKLSEFEYLNKLNESKDRSDEVKTSEEEEPSRPVVDDHAGDDNDEDRHSIVHDIGEIEEKSDLIAAEEIEEDVVFVNQIRTPPPSPEIVPSLQLPNSGRTPETVISKPAPTTMPITNLPEVEAISSPEQTDLAYDRYPSTTTSSRIALSQEERLFYECCNMLKGSETPMVERTYPIVPSSYPTYDVPNKPVTPKSSERFAHLGSEVGSSFQHGTAYTVKSPMSQSRTSPRYAYPKIDINQFSDISSDSNPIFGHAQHPHVTLPTAAVGCREQTAVMPPDTRGFNNENLQQPGGGHVYNPDGSYYATGGERSALHLNENPHALTARTFIGENQRGKDDCTVSLAEYSNVLLQNERPGILGTEQILTSPLHSNSSQGSNTTVTTCRMRTKAAMKGYDNFKVSIPTMGLDIQQALERSPHGGCKLTALAEIALGSEAPIASPQYQPPTTLSQPLQQQTRDDPFDKHPKTKPDINEKFAKKYQELIMSNIKPSPTKTVKKKEICDTSGNKQGFKAKKSKPENVSSSSKRPNDFSATTKVNENRAVVEKVVKDIYEFEESQEAMDKDTSRGSTKGLHSTIVIPERPFKNIGHDEQTTIKFHRPDEVPEQIDEESQVSTTSYSDRDDFNYGSMTDNDRGYSENENDVDNDDDDDDDENSSSENSSTSAKTAKTLIVGKIFKNATKSHPASAPIAIENPKKSTVEPKKKIPSKELNEMFDRLRKDGGNGGDDRNGSENLLKQSENDKERPDKAVATKSKPVAKKKKTSLTSETNKTPAKSKKPETTKKTKSEKDFPREIVKLQAELGMTAEEIVELIGEGKRKSQRKCAINRPRTVVDTWSSDEYEDFLSTKDIIAFIEEKEKRGKKKKPNKVEKKKEDEQQPIEEGKESARKDECDKQSSMAAGKQVGISSKQQAKGKAEKAFGAAATKEKKPPRIVDRLLQKFNKTGGALKKLVDKPSMSAIVKKESTSAAAVTEPLKSQQPKESPPSSDISTTTAASSANETSPEVEKKQPTLTVKARLKSKRNTDADSESDFESELRSRKVATTTTASKRAAAKPITKRRKTIAFRDEHDATSGAETKIAGPKQSANIKTSEITTTVAKSSSPTSTTTTGRPLARRKRIASEMLYYWSSSSSDEEFGLIETNDDDVTQKDDYLPKHGWIVGDSHKKLVTLLATAKGKKPSSDIKEPAATKKKT